MMQPSDPVVALLAQVRQGDEDALRELLHRYEHLLRRTARKLLSPLLRPYLDSLDIVQSVQGSLLHGLRQDKFVLSTPERFLALALTIVRRKVARHWRKIKRQPDQLRRASTPRDLASLSASPENSGQSPAEIVEHEDSVQHLLRHLEEGLDRQLVELRLQGYSTAEVAQRLGLDSGFLRVRLGRLRQRLQAQGLLTEWL